MREPVSSLRDIDASHQPYSQFVYTYQLYEWVAMFEDHLPRNSKMLIELGEAV